jgi:Bacteriophage terminase large (ATPase) subunit and inactivated derivatives
MSKLILPELPEDFISSLGGLETGAGVLETIRNELASSATSSKQDAQSLKRLLDLMQRMEVEGQESGMRKWYPAEGEYSIFNLPKHKAFFDAGHDYPERLFMAANRIGKSVAGAFELACHLTGEYPSWWAGRVFDGPIDAWACGKDARAVRDTAQKELLGAIGEWGTGMIPAHRLGKFWALQGTPQAVDIIKIKHKNGGWSQLGFKNYQQDIGSFMGTSRHVVWLDEECPLDIYNECNIRTATTDGIMMVTFTPLEGLTSMVVNFCKRADFLMGMKPVVAVDQTDTDEDDFDKAGEAEFAVGRATPKAVVQAGWDDAPWLTEAIKARLLEDTPIHLRDARTKGIPAMGSGNVYPIPLEEFVIEPFAIPDSWPRMYALDVGWNRTAAVWGALDPTTDILYIFDEHYVGQQVPAVHAYSIMSRGKWMCGVIDPASRGRSQTDGNKLWRNYKDLGLELFLAKNEFESGIQAVAQRLVAGKLKVFKTLVNLQKEYLLYRRDKHGKVIKENDHALDCVRYILNNMNRMKNKVESGIGQRIKYAPPRYNV